MKQNSGPSNSKPAASQPPPIMRQAPGPNRPAPQPPKPDFEQVFFTKANGIYPVRKYVSRSTGLDLIHVEIPGPVLSGFIVLGTHPFDNDGLPHTLEHLIFLGSEEYPYKGVLDLVANKCMSSGTNAWTDSDHTCYTFNTAGQDGFCCLLPIFMDHIFHPTLTDSGFLTEVHHITREGKDGGVVYSEMLAKQHSPECRTQMELSCALYPPSSSYHYNAGGILKNLRETCSNEKVKAYHAKYYTPQNARIIVCGILDQQRLFQCLDPVVRKLVSKNYPAWVKPVLDSVPELTAPKTIPMEFAAAGDEDEENVVTIGFLGPSNVTQFYEVTAIKLLFEYFCDSVVGPLEQTFTEGKNAICSQVGFGEYENARVAFYFEFEGVDSKDLGSIPAKLRKLLESQVREFDMIRMAGIVLRGAQEELSSMENSPRNICAHAGIADFLFGQGNEQMFEARMNLSAYKQEFLKLKASDWTALIKKHFLGLNWVTVNAVPSAAERARLTEREDTRILFRKTKFKEAGLEKLYNDLEAALAFNDRPIPSDILRKTAPPAESSINYHKIKRYENPEFIKGVGCNVYLDDIDTNFVYITIHMDTTSLAPELRKYLSILREAFTESPIKLENGHIIPFEEVTTGLTRDLINYSFSYGIDGGGPYKPASFQHIFCLKAQVQMDKIDLGFDWLHKLIWNIYWSPERLKSVATRMISDVKELRRQGLGLASALMNDILYKDESNVKCTSFIRQQCFLETLVASLPKDGDKIREGLDAIRPVITNPKNMTIHVATSLTRLRTVMKQRAVDLTLLVRKVFPNNDPTGLVRRLANTLDNAVWMHPIAELQKSTHHILMGLSSINSGHVLMAAPGIHSFNHPEHAALETAMQYFCQIEGPFFKAVRGGGYAYDFYMDALPNEGVMKFYLTKCSNTVEAFQAAKDVVAKHLSGEEWNEDLLASAKSSLCFDITEMERTPLKMSQTSLYSYYRSCPEGYAKEHIKEIQALKIAKLQAVTEKYISKLFDITNILTVVCPTNRVTTVVEKFDKLGYHFKIIEKLGECELAQWKF